MRRAMLTILLALFAGLPAASAALIAHGRLRVPAATGPRPRMLVLPLARGARSYVRTARAGRLAWAITIRDDGGSQRRTRTSYFGHLPR